MCSEIYLRRYSTVNTDTVHVSMVSNMKLACGLSASSCSVLKINETTFMKIMLPITNSNVRLNIINNHIDV